MKKSFNYSKDFESDAVEGVAELTDSQIRGIENSTSVRLNRKLTYVVPRQWVHKYKMKRPIDGVTHSRKVFVFGINSDNEIESVLTLSMNGLRQTHYGKCEANPELSIPAHKVDGLWRAVDGTRVTSVFSEGALPLKTQDKKAYVTRPFAFKVQDRFEAFVTGRMTEVAGKGWSMPVKGEAGKETLVLQPQTLNQYVEVDITPEMNISEDIIKEVASEFVSLTENLPG